MILGSLFSGGGLGDLGFYLAGFEIAWQVEIDEYCRNVLDLRWPDVKKYSDIKKVKGKRLTPVDLISGGFPCQPFSTAGNKRGDKDDRYLWPQMLRVISEVRPTWVVGENVSGIINLSIDRVLFDLEAEGYETATLVFPAHSFGAPHRRDRVWIMANSTGMSSSTDRKQQKTRSAMPSASSDGNVAYANGTGLADIQGEHSETKTPGGGKSWYQSWWDVEPDVGRVAHGVPSRVDRLKLLGNGQVVACTYFIGRKILEFETVRMKEA